MLTKIGTAEEIRGIDKYLIETIKIDGKVLMENAANVLLEELDSTSGNGFLIVCGTGNNGGDGFALGRKLIAKGCDVSIITLGDIEKMTTDCKANYDIVVNLLKEVGGRLVQANQKGKATALLQKEVVHLRGNGLSNPTIIDCLFGTGITREVVGIHYEIIEAMNNSGCTVISVDVPSGLDSDSGKVMGIAVKAKKTISFLMYKKGFFNYEALDYTGEVLVRNFGVPKTILDKFSSSAYVTSKDYVLENFIKRSATGHKSTYGRALVIAGSEGFTGAAYLSTEATVRAGAGLVTLGCYKNIQEILSKRLVEAMTVSTDSDGFANIIEKCDSIAIGPGLGQGEGTLKLIKAVLEQEECPTVIVDADGLNTFSAAPELISKAVPKLILTPHIGEFARLTKLSSEEILEDRIDLAMQFAKVYDVILLLKGYNTIITDGDSLFINPTGSSAMASGGMGDVLTGIINAFVAQGIKPLEATVCAAYLHGYCGDVLAKEQYNVTAGDVIKELPKTIKDLFMICS